MSNEQNEIISSPEYLMKVFERATRPLYDEIASLRASHARLLLSAKSALRYIEVVSAYQGAMTAAEVEREISLRKNISEIEIGANSCNTLASFDISATRAAITQAEAIK